MVLAVALAIAVVVRMARRRGGTGAPAADGLAGRAMELLALALLAGLAGTVLHRYRESRFFFTVCPLLWLAAANVAVSALDAGLRRLPGRRAGEGQPSQPMRWLMRAPASLRSSAISSMRALSKR